MPILHGTFSGTQFVEQMAAFPKVKFEYGADGREGDVAAAGAERPQSSAASPRRCCRPCAWCPIRRSRSTAWSKSIGWTVPIDDTHYRIYVAGRVKEKGALAKFKSRYNGKTWAELTPEEHQKFPGDTEAQVGQGADHLPFGGAPDVVATRASPMLRQMFQRQLEAIASGQDPVGVAFDEKDAYVKFDAGQYLED